MNLEQLQLGIRVTSLLISVLCFTFMVVIAYHFRPYKMVVKTYQRIQNRLIEQKSNWFDYQKTKLFLSKNGGDYHYGKSMDPIRYMAIILVMAAVGIFIGIRYHALAALVLAVVGSKAPKMYLVYSNKRDNNKILPEVKLIFHALAMQIRAGVYITEALAECYGSVTNKRLRSALMDLSSDIIMKSDFQEALNRFQDKFDNRYIDSLCVILLQAMESGQAVELLADIAEQIKDMENIVLQKKKTDLDRSVTFYLLGIMASILVVVIYACVSQMFTVAVQF